MKINENRSSQEAGSLSEKKTFESTSVASLQATPSTRPHRSFSDSHVEELCCSRARGNLLSTKNGVATSPSVRDELHHLGARLFDVFPYGFIRRHYSGFRKELVWYLVLVLFIYQALSAGLMSICEDNGFRAVFNSGEQNRYPEIVNRFLKFSLRMTFRVVLPLICAIHLPILATLPKIPKTNLSTEKTIERLMKVHEKFSSAEEVMLLRSRPAMRLIVSKSEEMAKRFIRSTWITIAHTFLLVFLFIYLGAFYVCEQNTVRGGMCSFLSVTIVHLPFIDVDFHFIITVESSSILLNSIIFGVVADCYHYENLIATYALTIGGEAEKLYVEIRQRWVVMDRLVCTMPLVMAAILVLSISTGKPFVSTPINTIQASDLADWYFWILVLTTIFFLGTSSNRTMKKACIGSCVIAAGLVFAVHVEVSHIPYGSVMVLLYTLMSSFILNLLYSLCRCYHSNARSGGTCSRWFPFVGIISLMLLLTVSLVVVIYRELCHFSLFVSW